jgi:hypothetical protein
VAVLLESGYVSVYHIALAVATAVEALNIIIGYLNEAERPHKQLAALLGTQSVVCDIFLCFKCKEVFKTFGGHTIPHLYENCFVFFTAVLCSCYRICLWCCREGNDRL